MGQFGVGRLPPPTRTALVRALAWAAIAGIGATLGLLMAVLVALEFKKPDLPLNADLYALNRPPALTFLDARGKLAGHRGARVGQRVLLTDMPAYLPAAFIAMEDRDFYHHSGIDLRGMLRAAVEDVEAGHIVAGGSTITQQLVKILFLTPDRTIERKLTEIAGARELEARLSKLAILDLYLNRVYLGSRAYGVDGAARVYFGKSAHDLTLPEAAMLAALTPAPSAFSPRRDLAAAQARASVVLDAMVQTGAITRAQAAAAKAHPATLVNHGTEDARNYFFDTAANEARRLADGTTGDLVIATTMNTRMQDAAQASLAAVLDKDGAEVHAGQGALVAMTPDGAVRALIGGRDYDESAFNRVTQAHRQPGSAFKVFVYLAALEDGLTPWTVRDDEPITIKGWSPRNYGGAHRGEVTLNEALADSINTVAVALGQEVGPKSVVAVARRLGIASSLRPNASLALGTSELTPLELTAAYAHFAAHGMQVTPYTVREIRNAKGDLLYRRPSPKRVHEIDEEKVAAMNAMLYDVVEGGTGRAAAIAGRDVAGKTGTTQDWHDARFVGYTPALVTGVWVGNDDSSPMKRVTGGSLPALIWNRFMRVALHGIPPTPLPRAVEPPDAYSREQQPFYEADRDTDRSQPSEYYSGGLFDWLFGWRGDNPSPPPAPLPATRAAPPPGYGAPRPRYPWRDRNRYP